MKGNFVYKIFYFFYSYIFLKNNRNNNLKIKPKNVRISSINQLVFFYSL